MEDPSPSVSSQACNLLTESWKRHKKPCLRRVAAHQHGGWGKVSQGSHLLALPALWAALGPLYLQWPVWNPLPLLPVHLLFLPQLGCLLRESFLTIGVMDTLCFATCLLVISVFLHSLCLI